MDAKSKKRNRKAEDQEFSAGILVTMTRAELATLKAAVPADFSSSQWCRHVLLQAANKPVHPDQLSLFGEVSYG